MHRRPSEEDWAEHERTYRGFVKGVVIFTAECLRHSLDPGLGVRRQLQRPARDQLTMAARPDDVPVSARRGRPQRAGALIADQPSGAARSGRA